MAGLQEYPRVTPFLWFEDNAEEAVDFYISIFPNSRRLSETRKTANTPGPKDTLTVGFELDGQKFTALNGGPGHKFNEAVSFVVRCDSQDEIDHYWSKLTAEGREIQCGWLVDKFGVSWQIVPARIFDYAANPKAMQALLQMKKLDIAELDRAARS